MVSKLYIGATVASFLGHAIAQNSTIDDASNSTLTTFLAGTDVYGCDALLAAGLSRITEFPGGAAYEDSRNTFYSQNNRNLEPNCIVQPTNTAEVSRVVKALHGAHGSADWDISVRSGGHSDWNNNAVYRGVSIDLTKFTGVEATTASGQPWKSTVKWTGSSTISNAVARIRPATRWGDVVTYLEQYGVSVTGGRSAHVGAGGLLVSGGASYHIQRWGLSCDNVINYEVVLASGAVVQANRQVNFDLFKALKGGGNNLGIVTRFDMRTFTVPPQGVYGGLVFSPFENVDANNKQFVKYASNIGSSGSADHQFLVYRHSSVNPQTIELMNMLVSTDGKNDSSNFADFGSKIPTSVDIRTQQPLSRIAATIADTGGSYYYSASLTLQPTEAVMKKCKEIFLKLVEESKNAGSPAVLSFVFQPLPRMLASVNPDGNILGLDRSIRTNQVLFEARAASPSANGPSKNAVTNSILLKAVEQVRKFSASQPNHSPYIYMNYASPTQNVLESYGTSSVAYLRWVAAKYDPAGFFQKNVPGGWKISRVFGV